MRILIIHTYYQHPGGEDAVFQQEASHLSSVENIEIETLTFQNVSGGRGAWQFFSYPFNLRASSKIEQAIKRFRPDVVHIHNLHYSAGPWVIRQIKRHQIPIVMTLHNYRLICPSATLFHEGKLFENSAKQAFPFDAIRHKVHANSALKTAWIALTTKFHEVIGTWNKVDAYLVLTEMAKDYFLNHKPSIFKNRISVKPNFLDDPYLKPETKQQVDEIAEKPKLSTVSQDIRDAKSRQKHFLFVGRLSEEKGINILLEAVRHNKNFQLKIAGDGPLKDQVLASTNSNPNVTYLGMLTQENVLKEMEYCSALIFPSIWFEGMPMTILQAFATSTPVIASDLGAMRSMIENEQQGLLFTAGDGRQLAETLAHWMTLPLEHRAQMQLEARATYERLYQPARNIQQLINLYDSLLARKLGNRHQLDPN